MYNSCGDRHCPQCAGAKRSNWLQSASELLLPGVNYFQVVFTIPQQLSSLALGNRKLMYDLLFHSAWRALRDTIAEEQGFEAAAGMVLHTWDQKVKQHAHIHAFVPGGGPSLAKQSTGERRWITSRRPHVPRQDGPYLVNADALRLLFRKCFLRGLRRLHDHGKLKLDGDFRPYRDRSAFDAFLAPLETIKWGTHIEPPPTDDCSPEHVLKYLARYLTGGPISDRRLISHENGIVKFWAREGTTPGGDRRQVSVELPGVEFVRRWSLHILPKNYFKTRRYGGYSNLHRQRYLAECRDLLNFDGPDSPAEPTADHAVHDASDGPPADEPASDRVACRCPQCGEPMLRIEATSRPSWSIVLHGRDRPHWYADG